MTAPARPRTHPAADPLAATPGKPAGVLDVEVGGPLPDVPASARTTTVLVRLHSHPVGRLTVPAGAGLPAARLAARIQAEAPGVADHLVADGLPVPTALDPAGLPAPPATPCRVDDRAPVPSITVVVATRDRTDSLLRCLRSLADQDHAGPADVVVVDNAPSDDATERAVAALGGRVGGLAVRYVREPVPGLARAHNRGLAVARGDWIAITDDDVVADRGWLSAVAAATRSAPGVGAVTGLILAAELETRAQDLLEQYGGFARGFAPRLFDLGAHRPADPLFPLTTGRIGSGANMAFDRALLESLGGFDAALGAGTPARGGDDLAGLLAVLRAGATIAYTPSAVVWHWHRREYAGLLRQARHYGVGLGAYLTGAVVRDPRLLATLLRGARPALRHLLDPASEKNRQKAPDFPRELETAERTGVLLGPWSYARSRWGAR